MSRSLGTAFAVGTIVVCLAACSTPSFVARSQEVDLTPQSALLGSGQTLQFTVSGVGNNSQVIWSVSGSPAGTIDANGNYTAPLVTQNSTAVITAVSAKDHSLFGTAFVTIIAPGAVSATANAQVAQYTIDVPNGLSVQVQFGQDTNYGLTTWALPAPLGGGPVSVLVAGMKGNTPYHMRAVFQLTPGAAPLFADSDQTFTTGAYPPANLPSLAAMTTPGQIPQPGVELLALQSIAEANPPLSSVVTDLNGNLLWAYNPGTSVPAGDSPNPIKLLPNGHFLINFSAGTSDGANSVVQEVDLAGQVVWQLTAAQLNASLAAASCLGCNISVIGTHHDFSMLPNGHLILLASLQRNVAGTVVTGDVIIDLDQNHQPVWLWNSFDWLDVNRHPMMFPDWLHSNSVVYSATDKSLVLSMRHQSWVIKINYDDGAGDGRILWRLGYQGDFTLLPGATNAMSPVDWFSAQHDANILTSSPGALDLLLFDDGNQRVLDISGALCGPATTPCDSRVPHLHLDENAKTAEIVWVDKLAPVFVFFGGSARQFGNGNIEFDECVLPGPVFSAAIFEVSMTVPPVVVWQMHVSGQFAYRGFRIPSLYPGVQW